MIDPIRKRITYANVVATLALFLALGGAAVAASQLPRNSVGPRQLKRGAVTTAKLRKKAVTAAKLAPRSVIAGKLGPNSVAPWNLGNGAVTTPKLGEGSVIARSIKNGVVTTNKLKNEGVTTPKLGNESVSTAKLGKESVTLGKLSNEVAPLLGTLKPGQTLRGVFDVGGIEVVRDSVSYPFPLLNSPTATLLKPGETNANCAGLGGGNEQTPQATAGNLCVYVTETVGTSPGMAIEHNTRLGFGLKTSGSAAEDVAISGLWAVTAP
jgi:hypothetical protein